MTTKTLVIIAVVLVLAVGAGLALGSRSPARAPSTTPASAVAGVVPVDVLASSPGRYLGRQVVSGSVTSVDEGKHTLVLGCSDACVAVPVQYQGAMPKVGANVVVTGDIGKNPAGQYALVASKVETK